MKQIEIAQRLGVSKAYISMVMNGKKQPSQRVAEELTRLGIVTQFEAKNEILSHACLPIPALPHSAKPLMYNDKSNCTQRR